MSFLETDAGLPEAYQLKTDYKYDKMVHEMMKMYSLSESEAWQKTEYDFMLMLAFENLEVAKMEFKNPNKNENAS